MGFPHFGLALAGEKNGNLEETETLLRFGWRGESRYFGYFRVFPRLEQALASPDLQHSSCVPRDEKYKLFSDLGNGPCEITGDYSQITSCFC